MKQVFTLVAFFIATVTFAQDATVKDLQAASGKSVKSDLKADGWKKSGTLNINGYQNSLNNWAAGGESSTLGINVRLYYKVNYKKGKTNWDSEFLTLLGIQNATSFGKNFRKSNDLIDITSKLTRDITKKWSAGLLFNLNTQALEGFDYKANNTVVKISNFLAPAKVLFSAGLDYKPNDKFSLFISPLTQRWVLKQDKDFLNQNKFGVKPGVKALRELGAFLTARLNTNLDKAKKVNYVGRLDLFSNYLKNPQNVDVFMTNTLTMQVTKNLSTTVSLDLIYDHDIVKKTQLNQGIGVGLQVNL